jgi:hypothetical protein
MLHRQCQNMNEIAGFPICCTVFELILPWLGGVNVAAWTLGTVEKLLMISVPNKMARNSVTRSWALVEGLDREKLGRDGARGVSGSDDRCCRGCRCIHPPFTERVLQ